MRVIVPNESRFQRTPDGAIWVKGPMIYSFWRRYLDVFDEVVILARAQDVPGPDEGMARADGPGVTLYAVPYYLGPLEYLNKWWQVRNTIRTAVAENRDAAFMLRVPGRIASMVHGELAHQAQPYGVEVVSDPYDVFAPGAIRHPLRPFLRWYSPRELRRVVDSAVAASYVTEQSLQYRYPSSPDSLSVAYSSIDLSTEGIVAAHRKVEQSITQPRLVFVGSLAQVYKGLDVLIDAIADLHTCGIYASLSVLGDGKHRPELEQQATSLGLETAINFVGMVPAGEAVRNHLDQADLFVMPSRTEGLPRAMVEAMARALPAVGSRIGGIPELLHDDDLVPADNAQALADKIAEVVVDPQRMTEMSRRNLERANDFHIDVLTERRMSMQRHLRDVTATWMEKNS